MKLSDNNPKNEKLKIEYQDYLKYHRNKTLKSDTVNSKFIHIDIFDEFCKYEDFCLYNSEKGKNFYEYLKSSDITYKTMFSYLNDISEFLEWVFINKKVKNKKKLLDELITLKPRDEDIRLSTRLTYVDFPTRDEFDKIIDFEEKSIEDKRDKAILIFLFISCARIGAVGSTQLKHIDTNNLIYKQDPLDGVKTKRQKHILTKLLPFSKKYTNIFLEWINYLKVVHNFDLNSPLFPKIKKLSNGQTILNEFIPNEADFNKLLEKRCLAAGVQKYHPHAFRHLGIYEALEYVRTGNQLKALSQNVGHEEITNILEQYAKMKPERYMDIIERMIKVPIIEKTITELSDLELIDELRRRITSRKAF